MAFVDKQNLYSEDQAITASAASSNIIDLGDTDSKVQSYNEKKGSSEIVAFATTSFNTCEGLVIKLQSSAVENFASYTDHQSVTVALADLVAGSPIELGKIPNGCLRYTRLYYTVSGSNPSLGKIHAGLGLDKQTNGVK